jgi:oligosaccharide repeat unit polymerase
MFPQTPSILASWPAALTLSLLALLLRASARSWLSTGPFYALVWSVYLLLPLALTPDYPVFPMGLWYIVLCVLAVCAGSVLAPRTDPKEDGLRGYDPDHPLPGLRALLVAAIVCGFLSSVVALVSSGRGFSVFLSGEAYVQTAHELSVGRYSEEYVPSTLSQILLTGVYLSPMLGGILFSVKRSRKDGALALASLLPAILIALLHTTRATFILGGILWLAGNLGMRVWRDRGATRLFTPRAVAISASVGGFTLVLFCLGQVVRVGALPTPDALFEVLVSPHLRAWFFGHLFAFSGWFEQAWDTQEMAWGGYSLAGLFDQLGLFPRAMGLYTEARELAPGVRTNIYTVFRGLIQDFTLPGALLFLWVVGLLAARAYDRTTHGHLAWMPILIAFYAFVCDYITSIFNYNSILLAWIFLTLYIWGICFHAPLLQKLDRMDGK